MRIIAGIAVFCLGLADARAQAPPAPSSDAPAYDTNLLGGMGGLRPALAAHGLAFTLADTSEVLGNPVGGAQRDAIFEGNGFASLALDGDKAGLWQGFSAQVSAWGIYGRGLSRNAIGNFSAVSNAEADRALRLFELWGEQSLAGGLVSVRVGQQAADQEFLIDTYAATLINADFGFPDLAAVDLPSGGPAYPQATPAVRVRVQPADTITVLAALFNGDPDPEGLDPDPQARDPSGTAFRTNGGAFWIGELDYQRNKGDHARGLPGTFKIGAWYNSNAFADQRIDSLGRSLADPASSGDPLRRRGDWSFYALADQLVWQGSGSIGVFLRVMGAPGDRNLIDYSGDAGVTWQGIVPARPDDTASLGLLWERVGDQASKLDGDTARFSGRPYPVRRWEGVVELTYQAQIRKGWNVQPDLQYIVRPGGGVPDGADTSQREGDALVLGIRNVLNF